MKKVVFSVAIIGLFAAACKKEKAYSCYCENPGGRDLIFSERTTKQKAQDKCQDYYDDNFGSIPFNETRCFVEE